PLEPTAVFGLERHHEAAAPLGDDRLLKQDAGRWRGDDLLQAAPHPLLSAAQGGSKMAQLRTGAVEHLTALGDGALDLLEQRAIVVEAPSQESKRWEQLVEPQ